MRHLLNPSAWASQIKPRFTPRRSGLDFITSLHVRCVYSGVCDPAASCADNFKLSAEKEELERQSRPVKEWLSSSNLFRSDTCCHTPAAACWPSPRGSQGHYSMQITMKSLSYMNNLRPGRWLDLAKGHGWCIETLQVLCYSCTEKVWTWRQFKRGSEGVNINFDI